ncbi:MAG: thiamine-phosphate kinase [Bacteroidales bacterium]|nr:thiamine-phosphate kinase [Bacteroidales bacterium]
MATKISEIGEFKLIERITSNVKIYNNSTIKGVGDDAAVVERDNEYYTLITTDLLVEGIHFNLVYTPLKHLGYKVVTVNLSDIAAMNGIPEQITVSLAISSKFSVEAIEELYEGIKLACQRYNVDLVGGDTTSSITGMMISVTAIGKVKKEDVVYRNGAKVNDLICVSGNLGAAYMGLKILEREYLLFQELTKENSTTPFTPDFMGKDYLLKRQLKPEARLDIIRALKEHNIKPTAMIDISDGLSSELHHICKQSGTGCKIYQHKIPIVDEVYTTAEEFNIAPETAALNGGEDYELLFTINNTDLDKVLNIDDIFVIGIITEKEEGLNLIANNTKIELKAQGWIAF